MKINSRYPMCMKIDTTPSTTKKRPVSPITPTADSKRPKIKGGFVIDSSDDESVHSYDVGSMSDSNDEDEDPVSVLSPRTSSRAISSPLPAKSLNRDRLRILLGKKNTLGPREEPVAMKHSLETSHIGVSKQGPVPTLSNYVSQQRASVRSISWQGNLVHARDRSTNNSAASKMQNQMRDSTFFEPQETLTHLSIKRKHGFETDSAFSAAKQRPSGTATSSQKSTNLRQRSGFITSAILHAQKKKQVRSEGSRTLADQTVTTAVPLGAAIKDYSQSASTTEKAAEVAGALGHQNRMREVQQGERFSVTPDSISPQTQRTRSGYQKLDNLQDIDTVAITYPFPETLVRHPVKISSVTKQPIPRFQLTQNQQQSSVPVRVNQTLQSNKLLPGAKSSHNQPQGKPTNAVSVARESQPKTHTASAVSLASSTPPNRQLNSKRKTGEVAGGSGENDKTLKESVMMLKVPSTAPDRHIQATTNKVIIGQIVKAPSIGITRLNPQNVTSKAAAIPVAKPGPTRVGQPAIQQMKPQRTTSDRILNISDRATSTNIGWTSSHTTEPNESIPESSSNTTSSAIAIQLSNNLSSTPPGILGTVCKMTASVDTSSRSAPIITPGAAEQLSTCQHATQKLKKSLQSMPQNFMNIPAKGTVTTTVPAGQPCITLKASATNTQKELIVTTTSSKPMSIVDSPSQPLLTLKDRVASTTESATVSAPRIHQAHTTISSRTVSASTRTSTTYDTNAVSRVISHSSQMLATATELSIDEGKVGIEHQDNPRRETLSRPDAKKYAVEDNACIRQSELFSHNLDSPVLVPIGLHSNQGTTSKALPTERTLPYISVVDSSEIGVAPSSEAGSDLLSMPTACNPDNLLTPPGLAKDAEPYFEYSIFQKLWVSTQNESDIAAIEPISRPFINPDEANAQAELLFQNTKSQYAQHFQALFSSISSMRDKFDCLTMLGTFSLLENPDKTSYLKIWIQRDYASKSANKTPQDLGTAPFISKSLYILRLFKLMFSDRDTDTDTDTDEDEAPPVRAYHPLPRTEVYTTLDAANRAARSLQIELSHEKNPKSSLTTKWQEINLRELNAKVHALDPSMGGKEQCWKSEFNGRGLGADRFELVVEQVRLCGPRNL